MIARNLKQVMLTTGRIFIILSLLFPSLGVTPLSAASKPVDLGSEAVQPLSPPPQGESVDPMSKLGKDLRDLVKSAGGRGKAEPVIVHIFTEAGVDLSDTVNVLSTRTEPISGGQVVAAEMAPAEALKVATRPDVARINLFNPIPVPEPLAPERSSRAADSRAPEAPAAPADWYGVDVIGAGAAWANGFTGEGVNVAVVDSGVDFGNPDLEGRQAVYKSGPYAGWPIALDPRSMREYVYTGFDGNTGTTSWNNYDDDTDYTWYAGFDDVLIVTQGVTHTFDFDMRQYNIAAGFVDMSQSGLIRWGVHPDRQLANYVFDDWIPVILIDSAAAGVYDTVIADLNNDGWFDMYDDVADKSDPILTQDMGGYLTETTTVQTGTWYANVAPGDRPWDGGYNTAGGTMDLPPGVWVAATNRWSDPDATDGADGLADVSGGMIYYIADGVKPIPGMDYLYPAAPMPLNGRVAAFMIGSDYVSNHGTLSASAVAATGELKDLQAATGERVQYMEYIQGTTIFTDGFGAVSGDWSVTGLWHIDHLTDTFGYPPMTYTEVSALNNYMDGPTASFNHDGVITPTYSAGAVQPGGTSVLPGMSSGDLTLDYTLPQADDIQFSFWSFEDVESMTRPNEITATQEMTIAVVGGNSGASWWRLDGDARLANYNFIDVGDDFTETMIVTDTYDALVVDESDADLTITETAAMRAFYDSGKPIVMGMDDVVDLDPAAQDDIYYIFGVENAQDDTMDAAALSGHPINQDVQPGFSVGADNDYFDSTGADWLAQDSSGNNYAYAYEGTARTVIMGEQLNRWYDNAQSSCTFDNGAMVSNAIIWGLEGLPTLPSCNPDDYDIRTLDISSNAGASWLNLYDSSTDFWPEGSWYQRTFDLSAYAGLGVLIRFRFDSIDDMYNEFLGWYVDQVEIFVEGPDMYLHDGGIVQGPAPGAKIIAIGDNYTSVNGMQGFYDAYDFLAKGIDGVYNNGDEFVQIVSMSYGGHRLNDGWDYHSRLVSFYNQTYLDRTLFLAATGNEGYGFGSVGSPAAANSVVSVGASSLYGATDSFNGGLEMGQINDGEVASFSNRGPNALGQPDPDVVATGAWAAGNLPLNQTYLEGDNNNVSYLDGGNAWHEWGGTSRSTPEAAGVAALLYQAYMDQNGEFPWFETARQILMSGADDLNHDILMQGAGRVNADRATQVAGGLSGVYVSPSLLAAGEYKGARYESFTNILFPSDVWSQTFTIYNPGSAAASATVGDEVLTQLSVLEFSQVVTPYIGMEDAGDDTYSHYATYFVGGQPMTATNGSNLALDIPAGADFMQVQLAAPFEIYDYGYDDPDPDTRGGQDDRWTLVVYDWDDRNGDSDFWNDDNGDGIVNPFTGGAPENVDITYVGVSTQTELSRLGYSRNEANRQEVTVRLGDRPDLSNVVIGLVHRNENGFRDMGSYEANRDFYQANPLLVKVTFYKKADWDLVSASPTILNVPAATGQGSLNFGMATFDATFTVPADQAPGLYEGAVTVTEGGHTSIVPVTVNVAVPDDEMLFDLGNAQAANGSVLLPPAQTTPYNNGLGFGGWGGGWYQRNQFFYDANAGFEQQYLYGRTRWGDIHDNMPTLFDPVVYGPNLGDPFSMLEPGKFGPYSLEYIGEAGFFWQHNLDDIAQPENRFFANLYDGLNMVQVFNDLNAGKTADGDPFGSKVGVFGVDAPVTGITIEAGEASGSFTLNAVSPVEGLTVYANGFDVPQWFRSQEVPPGTNMGGFPPDDVMSGWVYTFTAESLDYIEAETFGPGASDIDLYLFRDSNGNGIFNELVDMGINWGPEEYILVNNPLDGDYAVVMYGWDVMPGDRFDLRLQAGGGDTLWVEGEMGNMHPDVLNAAPGNPQTLTVHWEVPDSGVWRGNLQFWLPHEEDPANSVIETPAWWDQEWINVPIIINYGGSLVDVSKEVYLFEGTKAVTPVVTTDIGDARYTDEDLLLSPVPLLCSLSASGSNEKLLMYRVTVANNGDDPVDVEIRDLLPDGVQPYNALYAYDTINPNRHDAGDRIAAWWDANGMQGAPLNWNGAGYLIDDGTGDLPAFELRTDNEGVGRSVTLDFFAKIDLGYAGVFTNTVDVLVTRNGYYAHVIDTAVVAINPCVYLPLVVK